MANTVVVLGAGVGGLCAASRLRELLPDDDRVVLVDRSFDGTLGLSLLWVLRGWRTPASVRVVPGPAALPGIDMIRAEVGLIDFAGHKVVTDDGEIAFDALVVALGATVDTGRLPGLRDALDTGVAGEFYSLPGAVALRERLRAFDRGRLVVLVAGVPFKCPAAPFEAAFLIKDLLDSAGTSNVTVDTITPDPLPMPVAGPAVGRALVDMLAKSGIGFQSGMAIERIDPDARELVFAGGAREDFDLLAVVPPHRPPGVVAATGLGSTGWIPVDARTLATPAEGVWAVGDVTALMLPNGKPLPKAAVFAEAEADVVAAGVARHLGHEASEPWFTGDGACYIEVGGNVAAKGEGNFLVWPAPAVALYEPTQGFHQEKADQEAAWLQRWNI